MSSEAYWEPISEAVDRISAAVDVLDVRLFDVQSKFVGFASATEPLTWSVDLTPSVTYQPGDDTFVLEVEFHVLVVSSEERSESRVDKGSEEKAWLQFKYAALLSIAPSKGQPEPTLDELRDFGLTHGTLMIYPYARELVQNLTARMGLPPLTLSPIRKSQLPVDDRKTRKAQRQPRKRAPISRP